MNFFSRRRALIAPAGTMFSRKEILALLIPLIIEQFLSYLVGLADSVMVSSAGEAAVSAVSLVDSVSVLMVNIFAALATGGTIVVGQYLGLRSVEQARKAGQQLLVVLLALSLLVTGVLMLFEGPVLSLLFGKSDVSVQENCRIYYHIVMLSVPFIALYNGGAALFRAIGDSKTPMRISLLMNFVNICGNALLIYGFRLGVAGVAIPTLVSRAVAMCVILVLVFRPGFRLSPALAGRYHFDWRAMRQILSMGIPNGIENGMFQLGKLMLFSLVSNLSTASIAANAIGNTMAGLQGMVGIAVNQCLLSVISRCVGAGDYPQARWYARYIIRLLYLIQGCFNAVILLLIPVILSIYHVSPETARLATGIMLIHGIGMMTLWPLAFSFSSVMRAAGDVRYAMIVTVVCMWTCRVGLGYFFILCCNTGVWGIWYAWIIDWLLRITLTLPRYYGHKWESKSIHHR